MTQYGLKFDSFRLHQSNLEKPKTCVVRSLSGRERVPPQAKTGKEESRCFVTTSGWSSSFAREGRHCAADLHHTRQAVFKAIALRGLGQSLSKLVCAARAVAEAHPEHQRDGSADSLIQKLPGMLSNNPGSCVFSVSSPLHQRNDPLWCTPVPIRSRICYIPIFVEKRLSFPCYSETYKQIRTDIGLPNFHITRRKRIAFHFEETQPISIHFDRRFPAGRNPLITGQRVSCRNG